jgi:hypothetical protein
LLNLLIIILALTHLLTHSLIALLKQAIDLVDSLSCAFTTAVRSGQVLDWSEQINKESRLTKKEMNFVSKLFGKGSSATPKMNLPALGE